MATFYVTRWALTSGILKVEGSLSHDSTMLTFRRSPVNFREYVHGNDFHTTLEAANIRAEAMRQNRIKSAEKNLDKLRNMGVFKVTDHT